MEALGSCPAESSPDQSLATKRQQKPTLQIRPFCLTQENLTKLNKNFFFCAVIAALEFHFSFYEKAIDEVPPTHQPLIICPHLKLKKVGQCVPPHPLLHFFQNRRILHQVGGGGGSSFSDWKMEILVTAAFSFPPP